MTHLQQDLTTKHGPEWTFGGVGLNVLLGSGWEQEMCHSSSWLVLFCANYTL